MMSTTPTPVRVGLVGCGNVSARYLENVADSGALEVVACADLDLVLAARTAERFSIDAEPSVAALLARPDIELVLNLTIPAAHAAVSMDALAAGKHVYTEKPLATDRESAVALLQRAEELGLVVGCAPDTFMGAGIQACKALIETGAIGTPVSANAFTMNAGPERFHPAPDYLYRAGAGPLLDGGPYTVTVLVELLGRVDRVVAMATMPRAARSILVGDRAGAEFPVETSTHVASLLHFAEGVIVTMVNSFDVADTTTPRLEIHGTHGSIIAPAPNSWGGPLLVRARDSSEFVAVGIDESRAGFMGMGLIDMAEGLREGRPPRASGERGLHVLEVLAAIGSAAQDAAGVTLGERASA